MLEPPRNPGRFKVVGGDRTGAATEDTATTDSGILEISAGGFTAQTDTAGTYGQFSLLANGQWTYVLGNGNNNVQSLTAGQTVEDTFTAVSGDGHDSQVVTVTITGTNDVPTLGGANTGSLTEDVDVVGGELATGGALTIDDADTGESTYQPQTGGVGFSGRGFFSVDAAGNWTYAADNANGSLQALPAGGSFTDGFTVVSADGTAQPSRT